MAYLPELFEQAAQLRPSSRAVIEDANQWTFAELNDEVSRIAAPFERACQGRHGRRSPAQLAEIRCHHARNLEGRQNRRSSELLAASSRSGFYHQGLRDVGAGFFAVLQSGACRDQASFWR